MAEATAEKAAVEQTYHSKLLDIVKAWLSIATVVGGALWGLYVFVENEKKAEAIRLEQAERDNTTRRIEAQKPFLQLQFATYLKTTTLVGQLIQLQPDEDEYRKLRKEFDTLYWSELALVEDFGVSSAMVQLEEALGQNEKKMGSPANIKRAALGLARAMGVSIQNGWQGFAPGTGKNQK